MSETKIDENTLEITVTQRVSKGDLLWEKEHIEEIIADGTERLTEIDRQLDILKT